MLSKAGKDILIKACAQAIPTFAMSCFYLTKTLCEQISTMICRYWWSQQDKDKMHWLSWEMLTKPKSEGGLGFRDLYRFNLAMLARQAWRMLTNPNSLCARVLKARYFPSTSLLEATVAPGISYSWHSILRGVQLLKEGLIWRIGCGTEVNIWSDPWLNREGSRQPVTPRGQCLLTKVSELIDPYTGQWDEVLVRDTFWEMDVDIILATPIRSDYEDYLAWHFDSKGLFSVKSAYKLYVAKRDEVACAGSQVNGENKFWKTLWDLPCLPKVKQFMWRLAHNSLALKMNIKRRGIDCDMLCVCCKRLDEDGAHLFFKCKNNREIWKAFGLLEVCDRMCAYETAGSVVEEILGMQVEQKVLICCLLWRIWLRRNKLNAEGKYQSDNELIGQIRYWTGESKQYHIKEKQQVTMKPEEKWQRPVGDVIKLNYDGAFYQATRQGGWGFIACDSEGGVRGSGAGHIAHVGSALQAEAAACGEVIQAASDWGMGHI
jgi:hypothetical protein